MSIGDYFFRTQCIFAPHAIGGDFCISQGSVVTVLRWCGLNYSHLRRIFCNVACQKLSKLANVSRSYSIKTKSSHNYKSPYVHTQKALRNSWKQLINFGLNSNYKFFFEALSYILFLLTTKSIHAYSFFQNHKYRSLYMPYPEKSWQFLQ